MSEPVELAKELSYQLARVSMAFAAKHPDASSYVILEAAALHAAFIIAQSTREGQTQKQSRSFGKHVEELVQINLMKKAN